MNGDDLKLQQQQQQQQQQGGGGGGMPSGVSFPPTPESPMSQPDYSMVNGGGAEGQVLYSGTTDTTPSATPHTGNCGNTGNCLCLPRKC